MEQLAGLEKEVAGLRAALADKESLLQRLRGEWPDQPQQPQESHTLVYSNQEYEVSATNAAAPQAHIDDKLPRWAIERYSRQILLPEIGVEGQERLCKARVLVVGAGGLGCPAASYLAGAGVGRIGVVDYDTVDVTNLHRQLLHSELDQGVGKVDSAVAAISRLNSRVSVTPYRLQLTSANALQVLSEYEVVLDCTDNVPTRYLLNDACVLLKIPLISGSALKLEGQLTVYGYRTKTQNDKETLQTIGPCYRCLFPSPPPPETVGSCSSQGVAGPVPGVIGTLQALETIKLLVGRPLKDLLVSRMLLFDGEDTSFRTIRLRGQNQECAACSASSTITQLMDYEAFCKAKAKEKDLDLEILPPENRISAQDLAEKLSSLNLHTDEPNQNDVDCEKHNCGAVRHLLVDVRSEPEFRMCRIDGAVNYPIDTLSKEDVFGKLMDEVKRNKSDVTFVCRRGNDSQLAAQRVLQALDGQTDRVKDLTGGLHAWSKHVDDNFPIY